MTVLAANTKDRIINAAIELFSDKGYSETSMKDIARLAGIRPASIYNHFNAKEEILDVIMDEYIEMSRRNILDPDDIDDLLETTEPKEIIEHMFFVFAPEDAARYTKILKIITHEQFREAKAAAFIRDYLLQDCKNSIKAVLDKLVAAGKIKPVDTRIYAKLMISLVLSSSVEMMFYGFQDYQKLDRVTRRTATDFLIDQMLFD